MAANIASCSALIRQAAAAGATLICTPENTARMTALTQKSTPTAAADPTAPSAPLPPSALSFAGHPVLVALSALARELHVHILVGSIAVRVEGASGTDRRFANRSVLLAPRGSSSPEDSSSIVAVYDKLHLFDVPSLNGSESYLESARVRGGSEAVLVDLSSGLGVAGARLGMSVCYDLRFPHLYRALAQAGASLLAVPSAFTVVTGEAHWETLLRARAIETGAFVLAPAQVGTHPGNRRTYGHSLIVDPWGKVIADAGGEHTGIITATIDLADVDRARARVPSLLHDKPFTLRKVESS